MPVSHVSKFYAVEDAKIAALLTDPVTPPATYSTLIDIPGIKSVTLGFEIESKELRGDNTQIESDSTLVAVTLGWSNAKVNFDALAVMMGGTVTDTGTGSTEVATYSRLSTHAFSYFKFEAKTPTNGVDPVGGDAHIVVYKCKLTGMGDFGLAEEDYQIFSGEARGVARLGDLKMFDVLINETAVAIA